MGHFSLNNVDLWGSIAGKKGIYTPIYDSPNRFQYELKFIFDGQTINEAMQDFEVWVLGNTT